MSVFPFDIPLSITNVLLLNKYEYAMSIGFCISKFEAGLCADAPAEQLRNFFEYKIISL